MKQENWNGSLVWSQALDRPHYELEGKVPFPTEGWKLQSVFGIVSQPDRFLADWLTSLLEKQDQCQLRLIASVFPACATTSSDLEEFMVLEGCNPNRVKIRIFPERSLLTRATSLLCVIDENGQARLVVGSCDNMGFSDQSPTQLQVSTLVTADMVELLCQNFDQVWSHSRKLTEELFELFPKLRLPEGTSEGAQLWQSFLDACQKLGPIEEALEDAASADSASVGVSPTQAIGVKRLLPIERHLIELFRKGRIALLDESTRLKPVDLPIKPEWFDVERSFETGAIKSTTSMRISPFYPFEFKELEANRRSASDLIAAHSFSLGNKVRWMPDRVRPLFEKAMERLGRKWKDDTRRIVGDNLEKFVTERRPKLQTDAQAAYEKFHPGRKISSGSLEKIETEIVKRLQGLVSSEFAPGVSYSSLQYELGDSNGKGGSNAHAANLLLDMAWFQREAVLKTNAWMQRTSSAVDRTALVEAMDLLDDRIRTMKDSKGRVLSRAEIELRELGEMEDVSGRDLQFCTNVFEVIKGCSIDSFEMDRKWKEEHPIISQEEDDRFPF